MDIKECTSCGANITSDESFSVFPCPNCGEILIVRCEHCKKLKNKYKCSNCGFEGP